MRLKLATALGPTLLAALPAFADKAERAVAALGVDAIEFEGSDSLDNPNAVFE